MKHRWIWALALQIIEMVAVGLLTALSQGWGALPRGLMLWGVAPIAALLAARGAVLRGLNNYAACVAPIPCLFAANYLLWGFSPPVGPTLLAEFAALVGAAAGQVTLTGSKGDRNKKTRS